MDTKTIELVLKLGKKVGASDKQISELILEELQGNQAVEKVQDWNESVPSVVTFEQPSTTEPEQGKDATNKKNPLTAMNFGLTRERVDKFIRDYNITPGFKITSYDLVNKVIGYLPNDPAGRRACTSFLIAIPGIKYVQFGNKIKTKSTQWGISSLLEIGALAIGNPELPLEGEGK
jgi:hypothetical protein